MSDSFRLEKSERANEQESKRDFRRYQEGWTYYKFIIFNLSPPSYRGTWWSCLTHTSSKFRWNIKIMLKWKNKIIKICMDSHPLSNMKRMFCWVHRYSTVGVRVPIWRLRMLLKICATSFLPWWRHKRTTSTPDTKDAWGKFKLEIMLLGVWALIDFIVFVRLF